MRFLADMGISPKTVAFPRSLGHDAVHLHEQGLGRLSDPAILQKARQEGRVLLTHDLEFGELMAASGENLPTVLIFRLRDMRPVRQRVSWRSSEPLPSGAGTGCDRQRE